MTKSEKKFLKHVTNEARPLFEIQNILGWPYETTLQFAQYLDKHNLVRLSTFKVDDNNNYGYIILKPLIQKTFWEKYGNLISVTSGAILGAVAREILPMLLSLLQ